MADALSAYETSQTGEEVGAEGRFQGIRICSLLPSQVEGLRRHFDPSAGAAGKWPGKGGTFAARVNRYKLEDGGAGRKKLTVWYKEPTPEQLMNPKRAVLYVRLGGRAEALQREQFKTKGVYRVIEGPVENAAGVLVQGQEWVVTKGSNKIWVPTRAQFRVLTAVKSLKVPAEQDKIGKTNNAPLGNFFNAPKNTVRLDGMDFSGKILSHQYYGLVYSFTYDAEGFKFKCKSRKRKRVLYEVEDADETEARWVMGWAWEGAEEDRSLAKGETSFSKLNGMLNWY